MLPKNQIVSRQRNARAAAIKDLENKIDKALETADGLPVTVDVDGVDLTVVNAVKEKYEKEGGYTVRISTGDQREWFKNLVLA
jgi:hypothetical protein